MYALSNAGDLGPLIKDIAGRQVVMLGEASHGTHEYYTWRTAISKRLIQEQGFSFIAVEGDWPDCYLINRYVKGYKDAGTTISSILRAFDRWPTWMWANWEVAALVEWLKEYNTHLPAEKKVGFYGLDVYSLRDSIRTILSHLESKDSKAAQSVRKAMVCFEPYNEDEHAYARYSLHRHSCRDEVLAMLKDIRLRAQFLNGDREAAFNTEQNAIIAVNAERYYSSMMSFDNESWNIRDRHMIETLEGLIKFHGQGAKGIVWEHNTHIGDARATDMTRSGMVNTGQLAREKYAEDNVYLVGFGSYTGTVIAGSEWGAPMKKVKVPEAKSESIEAWLHNQEASNRYFLFGEEVDKVFTKKIGHRAIGVVYNPERERAGNYVPSVLTKRYNAFVYLDSTIALHPLHLEPHGNKMPETYPFGV